MRRVFGVGFAVLFLAISSARAEEIRAGHHNLLREAAGQTVVIDVVGNMRGLRGADVFLQIGDGTSGPKITDLSLSAPGLLFANAPGIKDIPNNWQAFAAADTGEGDERNVPAGAPKNLAIITLSTVGVSPGEYAFSLEIIPPIGDSVTKLTDAAGTVPGVTLTAGTLDVVPGADHGRLSTDPDGQRRIGAVAPPKVVGKLTPASRRMH